MEIQEQIKLRFKGVDFPRIELTSKQPYTETEDNKVNVEIHPRFFFPDGPQNIFKIIMQAELMVEDYFELRVTGVGTFELSKEDITEEERRSFIDGNSTAIMFPYMRALISLITSNVGKVVTPIILPARFFKGELEEADNLPQLELFSKNNKAIE